MKRSLSILLVLILMFSLLSFVKADSDGIVILTADKTSNIKVGDDVTITLSPSAVIHAGDFKIYYNKTYLEFSTTSLNTDHMALGTDGGNLNMGIIDVSTYSETTGYSSISFVFKALKGGSTTVSFSANGPEDALYLDQNNKLNVEDASISLDIDYIANPNWHNIMVDGKYAITGIQPGTLIENVLSSMNYVDEVVAKAYINNVEVTTGKVTTNTVIKIFRGATKVKAYYIIIYGDSAADGKINALDALTIVQNKNGNKLIKDEILLEAARVSIDTRSSKSIPTGLDALKCIKYRLGTGTIEQ